MSFGENPWFDVPGEIRRCDWLKKIHDLESLLGTYKKTRFSANHSAVIHLVHQTTDFRQTTV
jgi:hypothetical protein